MASPRAMFAAAVNFSKLGMGETIPRQRPLCEPTPAEFTSPTRLVEFMPNRSESSCRSRGKLTPILGQRVQGAVHALAEIVDVERLVQHGQRAKLFHFHL